MPRLGERIDNGDGTASIEVVGRVGGSPIPVASTTAGTDVTISSAAAAAANNVTLPGVAGRTTYLSGFEITGAGATAASVIAVTVTGTVSGTLNYALAVPAGAAVGVTPLLVEFARPIPASAPNTAIVVNVPSFGAGNTNAAVTAHGYQQ